MRSKDTGGPTSQVGVKLRHPLRYHGFFQSLLMLLMAAVLAGCVGTGHFDTPRAPIEKGNTSLDSVGSRASKTRMEATLAEVSRKRLEPVYWAGVSISGTQPPEQVCPDFLGSIGRFNATLVTRLAAASTPSMQLQNVTAGGRAALNPDTGLIMMVVINGERWMDMPYYSLGPIVEYEIHGQIVFLDTLKSMQLTAAYPIGIRLREPTPGENRAQMVEAALFQDRRAPDGSALSLTDQVVEILERSALAPRALVPPIAVSSVILGPEITKMSGLNGPLNVDASALTSWPEELARSLATGLAANTGLPVNPYRTSGDISGEERPLTQAGLMTLRRTEHQLKGVEIRLEAPTHLVQLTVDGLTVGRDEKRSNRHLTVLRYGFVGTLTILACDGPLTRTVLQLPLEFPPREGSRLPAALARKYEALAEVKLTTERFNAVPPRVEDMCRDRISEFMLQLAREISFPEEDLARRFEVFRAQKALKNASLPPRPMLVASALERR
jgi:hypothetical protein